MHTYCIHGRRTSETGEATLRRRPLFAGGRAYAGQSAINDEIYITTFASFSVAFSTFGRAVLNRYSGSMRLVNASLEREVLHTLKWIHRPRHGMAKACRTIASLAKCSPKSITVRGPPQSRVSPRVRASAPSASERSPKGYLLRSIPRRRRRLSRSYSLLLAAR